MSWQKCPACNGTGNRNDDYTSNGPGKCTVCLGAKIIHEVTGKPPVSQSQIRRLDCQGVIVGATGKIGIPE